MAAWKPRRRAKQTAERTRSAIMTTASSQLAHKSARRKRRLLPWTAGFQRSWLSRDLVAGVALGVVMIPQGMAYAELAGVPAVAGLYATMAAIVGYALLGSSCQLVVGPDSSTSTLVSTALLGIVAMGTTPEQYLAGAAFIAIVAGVMLLLGGLPEGRDHCQLPLQAGPGWLSERPGASPSSSSSYPRSWATGSRQTMSLPQPWNWSPSYPKRCRSRWSLGSAV